MTIHKEGFRSLLYTLLFLIVINYAFINYLPEAIWYVQIFSLVLFVIVLQFFRHPKRKIPKGENILIAPADGKVVVIEKTIESEYFNDERIQISIFMSPINVHVNRSPISGIVKFFKYHPGKFLVAWHPKSSTENERTTTVVEHSNGTQVLFRQIAGALARRIVWYIKENDTLNAGEEYGFIKFGSRIDVFLPLNAKINVSLEQKTIGGETIIAEF